MQTGSRVRKKRKDRGELYDERKQLISKKEIASLLRKGDNDVRRAVIEEQWTPSFCDLLSEHLTDYFGDKPKEVSDEIKSGHLEKLGVDLIQNRFSIYV